MVESITLKTVSNNLLQRSVTLWNGKDGVSLLGKLEHGTILIIDQQLVDQLQELVNERKPKPEIVPSKKLREAVKEFVDSHLRQLWNALAADPANGNYEDFKLKSFYRGNKTEIKKLMQEKGIEFYDDVPVIAAKFAIQQVALWITDGGTR